MKITDYSISMSGHSTYETKETEQMNLRSWVDTPKNQNGAAQAEGVLLMLSKEGKMLSVTASAETVCQTNSVEAETEDVMTDEAKTKLKLISDFVYLLTGKRIKFVVPRLKADGEQLKLDISNLQQAPRRAGWGIDFSYHKSYSEESHVSFSANGVVKTADGREINLQLNLNMSRSFYSETNVSFKAGDALIDPLVINLGNTPATLSDKTISFDIDLDGNNDNIHLPSSSSGFLALDKNNNGIIDDGSELFGPQSGNGFGELAQYDSDNNGWIDENDAIYDSLKIWQHNDSRESTLLAIGKAGIGAIYLSSVNTDFKYADNNNNTQGMLRQTGIYLKENGTVGTVQHIDLSI